MESGKRFTLPDRIAGLIILSYLIIGFFAVADYGLNWDDSFQRDNGLNNWKYLSGEDRHLLPASLDRYHGPVVELMMIGMEKALHLDDKHDIFLARHRFCFILYVLGVLVFYLLCRRLFGSGWLALTGMLLLILAPRMFGEAFYNPKDTPFLAANIFAFFTLLLLCSSLAWRYVILHAFTCAFAIDIRIVALLFIPVTIIAVFYYHEMWQRQRRYLTIRLVVYAVFCLGMMVCMWPILTLGPFTQLYLAYHQLSHYVAWNGLVKYLGTCYRAAALPWHYHWVYILVTLPETRTVLFVSGAGMILYDFIRHRAWRDIRMGFLFISLFFALFPLVFRSLSHAIVLDGWRHVYYIYPYLVLIGVYAVARILTIHSAALRFILLGCIGLSLADDMSQIISMHPFENVYFNHTALYALKPVDEKFEIDYWGLSYRQGLAYLISHHTAPVKVAVKNYPGMLNAQALPPSERVAIELMPDTAGADYFLTTYRDADKCPGSYLQPGRAYHIIRAQGNKVMGIYKLH
ncbi:MAG: glycosyltransferase family 39 protein [Bacteroidetes bacterium]|nr:glycosyltransferase family 39 protein [Bacteroidota bacterium]